MTAKNMKELEQMLLKEMKKAMNVASKKMLEDMNKETEDFYTQGKPVIYKRTGALGRTPETTPVSSSGNTVSFEAYLDTAYDYTTGDKPSMTQVLNLANYGKPWITEKGKPARDTLGKKGFWERAERKMENTLNETMRQFFN